MTLAEIFIAAVNQYVSEHGYNEVMSVDEVLAMAKLTKKKSSVLPSDYCYNRYNKGLKKYPECCILERIDSKNYRLLGKGYAYSGLVYQRKTGTKEEIVVGRWNNGVFSFDK